MTPDFIEDVPSGSIILFSLPRVLIMCERDDERSGCHLNQEFEQADFGWFLLFANSIRRNLKQMPLVGK